MKVAVAGYFSLSLEWFPCYPFPITTFSSALYVLLWSLSSLNNSGLVIHMLMPSFEVYSNRIYSPTIHKWVSILWTIWLCSPSPGRIHGAASRTLEQFVTDESLMVLRPVNPPRRSAVQMMSEALYNNIIILLISATIKKWRKRGDGWAGCALFSKICINHIGGSLFLFLFGRWGRTDMSLISHVSHIWALLWQVVLCVQFVLLLQ